jgi:3-deoxy-manno-octulosonate cytidylyltransferase (CMP-KDO synthetase)
MGSTRLPGKPLEMIGDKSLIQRCFLQAVKAGLDPYVATDSVEVAASIGIPERCVKTGECASGTDRVAAAAEIIDPEGKHEFVINYQGDMPFLDPDDLKAFVIAREMDDCEILTAWSSVDYVEPSFTGHFTRVTVESHIGLYGYTRAALRRFAATPQSKIEKIASLEQLRGSFKWLHFELPSMPIEINTQADLDRARSCLM